MYKHVIKRTLDIVISLCGILVLWLPMVFVAIAIKLDTPGPAFFTQRRVGLHRKEFTIYKFRTMRVEAPHNMSTAMLDPSMVRFTKLQLFLRSTSIDELPQIVNILRGDMSIVGPRPVLPREEFLLAEREKYGANDVLPGLTGWAQINGRDIISAERKARYDGEYADKLSFAMDLKCFVMTIAKVLRREGVVEGGVPAVAEETVEVAEAMVE